MKLKGFIFDFPTRNLLMSWSISLYLFIKYIDKLYNILMIRRSDSIHLKRTTSRVQKTPYEVGEKLDILEPISIREFRKQLPILPPSCNQALPNRIEAYLKSKDYMMLSTKRQQDANNLIAKAYRGLYKIDDVVSYLVQFRDLKKRQVEQFLIPYSFDGVVDWYRMIRNIYSKSRVKSQKRSLEQLVTHVQRRYRKMQSTKVEKVLGNEMSQLFPTSLASANNFQSLVWKLKKGFTSSVKNLRQTFQSIDKNVNGEIDIEEFEEALKVLNMKLEQNEIKLIFKEFDKNNQGFFKYQNFVEFLFGSKQLSSEKGYLNNLSLILQQIKADLKKSFQTADSFVKDINSKLSKYSFSRQFSVKFLVFYFNQLVGHKYSEFQLKQVHRQLYESIEYVKGLYNHIIKKTIQKRTQLMTLIAPIQRSATLTSMIEIVYYFISRNPDESLVIKRRDLVLQLKTIFKEPVIKTFFYAFKVGQYIRPSSIVKRLGITKLAAKLYLEKTLEEREKIHDLIKDRFDDELAVAGRNIGYAVEYHIKQKLSASDEKLLEIDPYKMYKVLPLFERVIDCRQQTVEKLILRNLALKFRTSFRILKAKNKQSKQMADYVLDAIIQKIITNPKRKKSIAKGKKIEPQPKKSVKGMSALSIRPATKVEIINSEFISDAKNIIINLIMSLPERNLKQKRLQNVLKQYIYAKQLNNHPVYDKTAILGYNNVFGAVVVDSQKMIKVKEQCEIINFAKKENILDYAIFENQLIMLTQHGSLEIKAIDKNTVGKALQINLLEQEQFSLTNFSNKAKYIKLFSDKLFVNLSSFSNSLFVLNTSSYKKQLKILIDPYDHFINSHIKSIISKIKSHVLERFPNHPKDFFRDILSKPFIDKLFFKNFMTKQVPKLFPAQLEQLLEFVETKTQNELYLLDIIRFIEVLELSEHHNTSISESLAAIQKSLIKYLKDRNITAIDLIDQLVDRKLGYIPANSIKQLVQRLVNTNQTAPTNQLLQFLDVVDNKISYKSFISFLSTSSTNTVTTTIAQKFVPVLQKYKKQYLISRSQCEELIYKYLPQFSHQQTQNWLNCLEWIGGRHLFSNPKQSNKLELFYPHRLIIADYYYAQSYKMLIYSVAGSNNIYIGEIQERQIKLIGIIKQQTRSKTPPLLHFIEQGLSVVTYAEGNIKLWNLFSLLIKQKSVSPPWSITSPTKIILFEQQVLSIDYLPSSCLLVLTSPNGIRFINIQTSQQVKKIIFKTRNILQSKVYEFKLPNNSNSLFSILVLYQTKNAYHVQEIYFQQLRLSIPGNQTQYKIPIKVRQNLDELGLKNISKKIKVADIRKNAIDYIVRTRKISNDATKIYFYNILKRIYLFEATQGLEKVYEMKYNLNSGLSIESVISMLRQLCIIYSPSTELTSKIKNTPPLRIESLNKTYQYETSYEQSFLFKLNRQIKIQILESLQSLDIQQLNVLTLASSFEKIQPSITRQEIQILMQKYQKPSTPVHNYFIPLTFFRNILIGKNTSNYIYRKIDKLINKVKEQRPGYYGYELFGKLQDKVGVVELRERLRDIGLKETEIAAIANEKNYFIQGQFKDKIAESLKYSEVEDTISSQFKNQLGLSAAIKQDLSQIASEQEHQKQENKKQQITFRDNVVDKITTQSQQVQLRSSKSPPPESKREDLPLLIDQIYTKIAINFGFKNINEIFDNSDTFQKQFINKINVIKALQQSEIEELFTSLKTNPIRKAEINQDLFKQKYTATALRLKQQRLDQIIQQLLQHIVVSINFKKSSLMNILKQYWCDDEGMILLSNFALFVADTGFVVSEQDLSKILLKLNVMKNQFVNVTLLEDVLDSKKYQFEKTVLNRKKWRSDHLSIVKQMLDIKIVNSYFNKPTPNTNILFKEFYKLLKYVTKGVVPDPSLKFITSQIFSGNSQIVYSSLQSNLSNLLQSQTMINRSKQDIDYSQFEQLIKQANPFSQIHDHINSISKHLKGTLTGKTVSSIRGIGIFSFNRLIDETEKELKNCSHLVPIIMEEQYTLPEYKQQHFVHKFDLPIKQIQYVTDQDMDKLGFIVNSKFEGYLDQQLCNRKLGVRELLSNLHQSDVQYKIGKFHCLEGFNPNYFLPNGAINFDWKVIVVFGKKILEQINKVHEIGYCLTNLRYTHLGRNGVIQQVYYPSKINQAGEISEQIHILNEDSNQQVYIAPQLLKKNEMKSVKIDSWSFGCLLYQFTFGKLPPKYSLQTSYYWLSQPIVHQLLTLQHQQITEVEYPNETGLVGARLLLEGLKNIYKSEPDLLSYIEVIQQTLKIIDLCLNVNPIHRPSTQQLAKYQIFQDKKQTSNQQNEQVLTVTSNIMKNGGLNYRYKYAVHLSELQNMSSLEDQVNILAQSIPMNKIKNILVDPICQQLLNWIEHQQLNNLDGILQKTTNLLLSTANKFFPQTPPLFSLPKLKKSVFSDSIQQSKISKNIQNKWIKLLMNSEYLQCLTYLVCKSRQKSFYQKYFKLINQIMKQLKKYNSAFIFYIDRVLIQILKLCFGVPIGFSEGSQKHLRHLISTSLNQQYIDEFLDPSLLILSSDFDIDLSRQFIRLYESILSQDGLPSTQYQPIYEYLITNPDKLRYFDSMGNILRLQVTFHTNGMANPKSRQLTINKMQQIINYISQNNKTPLQDSKCHLLFISILNSSDQQVRKKGLKYFQALIQIKPLHPVFSTQVLLLSLFGNLRMQSERTDNKVISLKIFKQMAALKSPQSNRLKGSYYNTYAEILRLGIAPKQKSLETSTYLELKPHIDDIVSLFKDNSLLAKIVEGIQGSQTILQSFMSSS